MQFIKSLISVSLSLLLAAGCVAAGEGDPATPTAVPSGAPVASAQEDATVTSGAVRTSVIVADGENLSLADAVISGGAYDVAISVGSLGTLTATGITASAESGQLLSVTGGTVSFAGSVLTGGSTFSGTCVADYQDVILSTVEETPLFQVSSGNTDLGLSGVSLAEEPGTLLSLTNAEVTLQVTGSSLSGAITLDDPSTLTLVLSESAYTGCFDADACRYVVLTLGEGSSFTLTDDTYLDALTGSAEELETILSRIQSNGFTLYYNAENVQSAWLNAKAYSLSGGGTLSPLI